MIKNEKIYKKPVDCFEAVVWKTTDFNFFIFFMFFQLITIQNGRNLSKNLLLDPLKLVNSRWFNPLNQPVFSFKNHFSLIILRINVKKLKKIPLIGFTRCFEQISIPASDDQSIDERFGTNLGIYLIMSNKKSK